MMAVPNANYANELIATTLEECSPIVFNGVYQATPLLKWFKANQETVNGGRKVTSPLLYAGNSQGKWFTKGEAFAVGEEDQITRSNFDWKYLVLPLLIYDQDEMMNAGQEQIVDLVKTKVDDAQMAIADKMSDALLASSWTSASKLLPALAVVVDTTTDLGDIDASEVTSWRSQVLTSGTFSVNLIEDLYNDCGLALKGGYYPDVGFWAQDMVQSYKVLVGDHAQVDMTRATSQKADISISDVSFRGKPIYIESGLTAGSGYFLHSKLVKMVAHTRNARSFITKQESVPLTPGATVHYYWGAFSMRVRARSPLAKFTGLTAVT